MTDTAIPVDVSAQHAVPKTPQQMLDDILAFDIEKFIRALPWAAEPSDSYAKTLVAGNLRNLHATILRMAGWDDDTTKDILRSYYDRLRRADWNWSYAESSVIINAGREQCRDLDIEADLSVEHRRLHDAMKAWCQDRKGAMPERP